jgi:multicomponent Na+:H+ antiporter subunit A
VVVFVLVLRRLPDRFAPTRRGQLPRILLAGLVGLMMTGFVLVAGGARVEVPVSAELVARSLDQAGGRNVVNVILVDFRGYDTLGEITVLVVAGLGITSLVVAGRTRGRGPTRGRNEDTTAVETASGAGDEAGPGGTS